MTYAAVRQGLCCCSLNIQTQDSPSLDEHDAFVFKALGSIVPIPFPEKANRTQITLLSIIKLTQISHLGPDHWWRGQRRAARIELRMVVTDNKEPERAIGHMIPFISSSCFATRVSVGFRPTQTYTHSSEKKNYPWDWRGTATTIINDSCTAEPCGTSNMTESSWTRVGTS